jgi:aromatic-L-amino-acid decarboxylase
MSDIESPATTPVTGDMPAEDFREYGHQMVDWIADYFDGFGETRVTPEVEPGFLRDALPDAAPAQGEDMADILADVDRFIMPGMTHWNHPSFHAYFNSSGSGPGVLGELLGSAFNVNCMLWESCPAATELEEVTLAWLRKLLGLPESFWGIVYDGASTGNLCAIAAARAQLGLDIREQGLAGRTDVPRLRLYMSRDAHSSVDKAALTLGLGRAGVRKIPMDGAFRLRLDLLKQAIAEDRAEGCLPFCVVGTVGTTSTTAIDPIAEIAEICEAEDLWLHVDAAHGGSAAVVPEMRHVLEGCDRADSVLLSTHKWMFVPLNLCAFYTRKPKILKNAFSLIPEYLRTAHDDAVTNYMDYGVELGRRFRALKLWFVLRYFGTNGLIDRIREHIRLGQLLAEWIDGHPEFQRMAPTPLSTVCFRASPTGIVNTDSLNELNRELMAAVNGSGKAYMTHTMLGDRLVLRFVVSHLRTTEAHVRGGWEVIQAKLREIQGGSAA